MPPEDKNLQNIAKSLEHLNRKMDLLSREKSRKSQNISDNSEEVDEAKKTNEILGSILKSLVPISKKLDEAGKSDVYAEQRQEESYWEQKRTNELLSKMIDNLGAVKPDKKKEEEKKGAGVLPELLGSVVGGIGGIVPSILNSLNNLRKTFANMEMFRPNVSAFESFGAMFKADGMIGSKLLAMGSKVGSFFSSNGYVQKIVSSLSGMADKGKGLWDSSKGLMVGLGEKFPAMAKGLGIAGKALSFIAKAPLLEFEALWKVGQGLWQGNDWGEKFKLASTGIISTITGIPAQLSTFVGETFNLDFLKTDVGTQEYLIRKIDEFNNYIGEQIWQAAQDIKSSGGLLETFKQIAFDALNPFVSKDSTIDSATKVKGMVSENIRMSGLGTGYSVRDESEVRPDVGERGQLGLFTKSVLSGGDFKAAWLSAHQGGDAMDFELDKSKLDEKLFSKNLEERAKAIQEFQDKYKEMLKGTGYSNVIFEPNQNGKTVLHVGKGNNQEFLQNNPQFLNLKEQVKSFIESNKGKMSEAQLKSEVESRFGSQYEMMANSYRASLGTPQLSPAKAADTEKLRASLEKDLLEASKTNDAKALQRTKSASNVPTTPQAPVIIRGGDTYVQGGQQSNTPSPTPIVKYLFKAHA